MNQSIEKLWVRGEKFKEEGRLKEAIAIYQQLIELDPNLILAYFNLGELMVKQQKWSQAIRNYQKIIELQPNFWQAYSQLGDILLKQQKWHEAITIYRNVIKLQPNSPWFHNHIGKALLSLKQWQEATKSFSQAIKLNSNVTLFHSNLGQALIGKGHYQEAINCYEKALELSPKSAECYLDLGKAWRYKGNFRKAVDCFQKAIQLQPTYVKPYTALQYTKIVADQLDELIALYYKVLEIKPDFPPALANLGDALSKQGKIDLAIQFYQTNCYKRAIYANPKLAKLTWKPRKEKGLDFIVIGVIKGGTSSLHAYLGKHPQILLPQKKELQFFSKNFDRGINWYLAHFPSITDYPDFCTGEASPGYFSASDVEKRIFQFFPDVKLILLLRNPVDRAISSFYQKKKVGKINGKKTFTELVTTELQKFEHFTESELASRGNSGCVLGGLYIYQLQRWMNLFPKEQLLILQSEYFFNDPAKVMTEVFDFLNLPQHQCSDYRSFNAGCYSPMSNELRHTLREFFRPHNQRLEKYLGRKFNWD